MNGIGLKELSELRSMIKESKKNALQKEIQKNTEIDKNLAVSVTDKKSQFESSEGDRPKKITDHQKDLLFEFKKASRGRPKKEEDAKSKKSTIYLKPNVRFYLKRFRPEKSISKKIDYIIEDYQRLSEWQARVLKRFESYSKKIDLVTSKMNVMDAFDQKTTDKFTNSIFEISKEIRTYMNICSVNISDIEKYLPPDVLKNLKFALSYTRVER